MPRRKKGDAPEANETRDLLADETDTAPDAGEDVDIVEAEFVTREHLREEITDEAGDEAGDEVEPDLKPDVEEEPPTGLMLAIESGVEVLAERELENGHHRVLLANGELWEARPNQHIKLKG